MAAPKTKRTYFAIVPCRALDTVLSDAALAVLLLMCASLDSEGWVKYTVAEMARRRGVSPQALRKQIDALIACGIVEKHRDKRVDNSYGPSRYRVLYDTPLVTPEVTTPVTEMTTSEVTTPPDVSVYLYQEEDSRRESTTHSASNGEIHPDHVANFIIAAKGCGWTPMASWRPKVSGFIDRARKEHKSEAAISAVLRRVAETGKPFFDDYIGDYERQTTTSGAMAHALRIIEGLA